MLIDVEVLIEVLWLVLEVEAEVLLEVDDVLVEEEVEEVLILVDVDWLVEEMDVD